MVAPVTTAAAAVKQHGHPSYASLLSNLELINVFSKDIEIHEVLSSPDPKGRLVLSSRQATIAAPVSPRPTLAASLRWVPYHLTATEKDLLHYCESLLALFSCLVS